jgi:hypothetical protein
MLSNIQVPHFPRRQARPSEGATANGSLERKGNSVTAAAKLTISTGAFEMAAPPIVEKRH